MSVAMQMALGFAMIAGLLAIQALALYVIWWVVLRLVAFLPMIGKKYRHEQWERLNRTDSGSPFGVATRDHSSVK